MGTCRRKRNVGAPADQAPRTYCPDSTVSLRDRGMAERPSGSDLEPGPYVRQHVEQLRRPVASLLRVMSPSDTYKHLFEPRVWRSLQLPSRVLFAPINTGFARNSR